ncbi:unnamed protein product, partial [Strongylus vulgaris]
MSIPPPNASQPPPGYPSNTSQPPPNLILPSSLTSQPPPNIQALLKSIPSLQTIQQATAAAAAAAAASTRSQNLPSVNFPTTSLPQRLGDVDERMKPPAIQSSPHVTIPVPSHHQMHQPPPSPLAPIPNYHQHQPISQQPSYAEEG